MLNLGRRAICLWAVSVGFYCHAGSVDVPLSKLLEIYKDQYHRHEMFPLGVPKSYDWSTHPRLGAGNNTGSFSAITGWGQIFWAENSASDSSLVQIRKFKTFTCQGISREWSLVQDGGIEGRQFMPDYSENYNELPRVFGNSMGVTTVGFDLGRAFHFWPGAGRADVKKLDFCGVLVVAEVRALSKAGDKFEVAKSPLLVGFGADYWLNKTAPWDNYKTNRDLAIGRLRVITSDWTWFGMTTAAEVDIKKLSQNGYEIK